MDYDTLQNRHSRFATPFHQYTTNLETGNRHLFSSQLRSALIFHASGDCGQLCGAPAQGSP